MRNVAEIRIEAAIRSGFGSQGIDRAISVLAAGQQGAVARWQLLKLGVSATGIQRRVQAGRLHVVFLGVYAVGHRKLSKEGRWMSAVLAGGTDAVLSDNSAGALAGFVADDRHAVHVTAPGGRARPGIRMHRRELHADEITTKNGIPTTTAARTLLDLAATTNATRLERALREALFTHATSLPALRRLLSRHPGHRGAGRMRAAITAVADAPGRVR